MTQYNPDKWLIIKITDNGNIIYKVFGSWYGGFLDGDSWRCNSGITKITFDKKTNTYHFFGESGSVYICHKDSYGASAYGSSVLQGFMEKANGEIESLTEEQFLKIWTKFNK